MMKKTVHIFLSFLLIVSVVYGGSGINIYQFCCDECRSNGLSSITQNECCEIHHHHHLGGLITHYEFASEDVGDVCKITHNHDEECSVQHLGVTWNVIKASSDFVKVMCVDLSHNLLATNLVGSVHDVTDSASPPGISSSQKPPNLPSDAYFTFLNFLII